MSDDFPELDCAEGAPHPRHTAQLLGQSAAETAFLEAYTSDRLHHAWLITGPRGVGKATLAWRIARFMVSREETDDGMFGAPPPPTSLDCDFDHPVVRRSMALAEPRLQLCRREWDPKTKRPAQMIRVDEVRKLKGFFGMSAADGGWRVAIVDSADEMNVSAANALLKILEEPPEKVLLLLVSHQPAKLLPTIRSRCRTLRCQTLSPGDQAQALTQAGFDAGENPEALAVLSAGSVGESVRLLNAEGVALYARLVALAATAPGLDREAALNLANKCSGRDAAAFYDMTVHLVSLLLARLARFGALQPQNWAEAAPREAQILAKLAPDAAAARKWANLAQDLTARVTHARAVNLDPSGVILDMLLQLDETARK